MPRVLIAGCGYVGAATADLLHDAGWVVEGWTRSLKAVARLSHKPYRISAVDISVADQVSAAPGGDFDAVIHCASTRGGDVDLYRRVYLNGTRNLLDRFPGATILFTSSTSVYAQKDGDWVTEESETNSTNETGPILLETEKLLLNRKGVVTRLAAIYGPGRSMLLKKFLSGEAVIDPENERFINQVHRDDIAVALFLLLNRESSAGQIYNVVDNQPLPESECYRWLAERLDRRPPPFGKTGGKRKRGGSNKRVSNAKLRGLGWTAQYPSFAEAMGKSILPSFPNLGIS